MKLLIAFLERSRLYSLDRKNTTLRITPQVADGTTRFLRIFFWTALLLTMAEIVYPGCALMTNGPKEKIRVRSAPAHARVYLNDRLVGEAPVTVRVARLGSYHLRVELDGFEPAEIPLHLAPNPVAAVSDVVMGGAPLVIDLLTGAIFELQPPKAFVDPTWTYAPENVPEFVLGLTDLGVLATLHPTGNLRKIGQMQRKKTKG